ncbi:MAG: hypothetical protein NC102_04145 [Clostridium sp.]|nr:hypothetical protein [Clostridium sp.]
MEAIPQNNIQPAAPAIPDIEGIARMTPLEMNAVRFSKRHTVLTPKTLASIGKKSGK